MTRYEITTGVVNAGTIVFPCNGTCSDPRLEHRYMFYSIDEAKALYEWEHTGD